MLIQKKLITDDRQECENYDYTTTNETDCGEETVNPKRKSKSKRDEDFTYGECCTS